MKQCIRCNQVKELSEFHKHKGMKDGHLNKCAVCVKECVAEWREQNPEARKKEHNRRREKEGFLSREEYLKKIAKTAKGKAQTNKDYYLKNKEKILQYSNEWWKKNKNKRNAKKANYRASKLLRTTTWADKDKIKAYYDVCAFFNEVNGYIKYHVDHIVPLQGEIVSGLHVHNNLQVILAKENVSKNNKWSTQ